MNLLVIIDWKFAAALGLTTCGIILVSKINPDAAERVSTHAVDALSQVRIVNNDIC